MEKFCWKKGGVGWWRDGVGEVNFMILFIALLFIYFSNMF